uniref:Protein LTV1 homolog n=1 Tax=Rhabditophanes sp. KR3021 TaxID=114890 RepID=A0AC35UAB3_9BILA
MGGKRKAFISRKEALQFSVVQRSVRDPLIHNTDIGENILKPIGTKYVTSDDCEERISYGVYYDDDYDYLKHMKSRDEVVSNDVEIELIPAAGFSKAKVAMPSNLFETKGVELVKEEVDILPGEDVDDDIMEVLDGRFDFEDPSNELDDHFFAEFKKDVEEEEEYEDEDEFEDTQDERKFYMDKKNFVKFDGDNESVGEWDDQKTRFTNYSMSSAVIKRDDGLATIDEKFETFYAEYDDEKLGEIPSLDAHEVIGHLETDDNQFKMLMADAQFKMPSLPRQKMSDRERDIAHSAIIGDDQPEDYTKMKISAPKYAKQKWDVESITSTYSNIYNHPKSIGEVPSRKRIIKESISEDMEEGSESDDESVVSGVSTMSFRPKGETSEERRLRKKAVKEQKRARRVEKSGNKEAFKMEKKRIDAQNSTIKLKIRKIN